MSDSVVSRIYGNFRGVDFRGEEINLSRSPDALNVWKDYRETESIRTRPGLKRFGDATGSWNIHGIYFYKGFMLVHQDDSLCRYTLNGEYVDDLLVGLNDGPSQGFVYEDIFYFKDGIYYVKYDGEEVADVEGYIPTTSIGRRPAGGGSEHEDVNMLSPYRINTFLGDGRSKNYYLDTKAIDAGYGAVVEVDGEPISPESYAVYAGEGRVEFFEAPHPPRTDGQDNVKIQFKKEIPGYRENILDCTLLQVFDNRVFFSGNPNYPNVVWHCSLNDPTYCSDLDYYREGMDSAEIRGMVAGNNALWVFRSPSEANTNVFYHTPTLDDSYGKVYPSVHSSVAIGCVGRAINFNDDIVFFSERGMEGISGDVTTEQVAAHRSSMVDRKMLTEEDYANMVLAEWNGYLLVFIGTHVYLADSRGLFSNENHMEYEWFYWDIGVKVLCAVVHNGVLYIGTNGGVYTLTDDESPVESYWVTPKDKFKNPYMQKTTNKRGCVAEATGDVTVYVKTESTDFEQAGEYSGVEDYFACRIKRKKFKDLQLKFHSNTRFSLETVTMEVFIGGYIKR